jgi:hypothetical protein
MQRVCAGEAGGALDTQWAYLRVAFRSMVSFTWQCIQKAESCVCGGCLRYRLRCRSPSRCSRPSPRRRKRASLPGVGSERRCWRASVRVERLSGGTGLAVPPLRVHVIGRNVRLQPRQAARIPLELVVPAGAKMGAYLSDVVLFGSAAVSAGRADLGVAAATKLEFSVGPGPVPGPGLLPALPSWAVWAMTALLLLAVAVFAFRRAGFQVRVERKPAGHSPAGHHGGSDGP